MPAGYKNRTTPGVYITELNAFPPTIVGVQTAVPAFIGFTEFAALSGKPAYNKAIKVGSMLDFETYFGKQYPAVYTIMPTTPNATNDNYDFKVLWEPTSPFVSPPPGSPPIDGYLYYFLQDPPYDFLLYDSMRLFYANGGGTCYVVSVGNYATAVQEARGVTLTPLLEGLKVIKEQSGPTMLVIPDAVLLPGTAIDTTAQATDRSLSAYTPPQVSTDFGTLVTEMLKQCVELQDRVAILDVYGSQSVKDASTLDTVISQFRSYINNDSPSYGMAYFPFLHTTVMQPNDFNYTNLTPLSRLQQILRMENQTLYGMPGSELRFGQVNQSITNMSPSITDPTNPVAVTTLNQNLSASIPLLTDIERVMIEKNSVLPPSAAMAGVYTYIDGTRGVWNAPANIGLTSVDRTTYKLNDKQQGELNMPIDGKAIDALREFVGRGTIVWGARTLDGNSNDWRYIQIRRTIIYIEQSVKAALNPFVFAPNDANTWVTVTAMVSNFLETLWAQGGLMGAKSSDAFTVQCGLGTTMTGMDVLNGYMVVQITLQMIHPAEFIELTFKQKMEGVG
ncbi:MAG TPA: phage tail sheath C-terminal domain-containing protein [Pyrinomonadaceae bacterium]|jgi:hypothetical protein